MDKQETIFEELKHEAEYAQRSYSEQLLYQAYGKAQMARKLGAITDGEFMELNSMTVRFMNTDLEYIHRRNMEYVNCFNPKNRIMTPIKILAMGVIDDSTEVYVRRGGASFGVLAHGNRKSDGFLKYAGSDLESFTWQDDNKVYVDLKEQGKEEAMKEYRVRFWREDGSEDSMEFDSQEQARGFYDSMGGVAEVQRYIEEHHAYETIVAPTYEF